MPSSNSSTQTNPCNWSFADPELTKAIEDADQKYQNHGSVFYVIKTLGNSIEVFSEFEMKMKNTQILELIYSPDAGFHFPQIA